jgi:hypothetical protein
MDPGVQTFRRLWIDVPLSHHASERGLNVLSGAPESIIEIEMPERGVEVVTPKQRNHPAAEPDAFRVTGRAADLGGRLGKFIDPALGVFCRIALTGLRRLVARLGVAGLGERQGWNQRENRRTECNGQDDRREGHDRAGFLWCRDDRD